MQLINIVYTRNYSKQTVMMCNGQVVRQLPTALLLLDQSGFISPTCHSGFAKLIFELFWR